MSAWPHQHMRSPTRQETLTLQALLAYVERLPVSDPLGFVINNPSIVLDMDAHGLPSAIDGNLLW